MDKETIWLVTGHAGQYDDRTQWEVKAFRSVESANRFAEACQEEAVRIEKLVGNSVNWRFEQKETHSLDPNFYWLDVPTRYEVCELELDGKRSV